MNQATSIAASGARNPIADFDPDRIAAIRVNAPASMAHAARVAALRPQDGPARTAWLLRAITLIDLTTLAGDDTPAFVRRLCACALRPLPAETLAAHGLDAAPPTTAAVCVYPALVPVAVAALSGSGLPVAAVATGFPAGQTPLDTRLAEIRACVAAGATEIDIVIARRHALTGDWARLHEELCQFREACGPAHMKAILATGELGHPRTIARAAHVAMMAGADFIKTSTGKEAVNATLLASLVMLRAIRDHQRATGHRVGFKPAGGIGTADQALGYMALVRAELGPDWLTPDLFRFGASSLLGALAAALHRPAAQ